jgi:hypothetical protein
MACRTIVTEGADGKRVAIIVCGPRGRAPHACSYCTRPHTKRCDFKLKIDGGWRLCNQYLCAACAVSVGDDLDHCRAHGLRGDVEHEPAPKQGGLPIK